MTPASIAAISGIVAAAPGRVSAVVRDRTGVVLDVDGGRVVPAASTVKVAVLLAALDAVQDGALALDGWVPLPERRVGGAGALHLLPSVPRVSVAEALDLMVALSDNDATNALLDVVGERRVADVLDRCGARRITLQRRLMDSAAAAAGRDNLTSAGDLARLLAVLREGGALDGPRTRLALEVLGRQQALDGLPARVPPVFRRGSKAADLPGIRHDMALFEVAGRWASVAVTAIGLLGEPSGVDLGSSVLPHFARIGAEVTAWLAAGA